ncbi:alpha/beta hydrolase family protein [Arthrobacter castelli]|uniref:alpha/beta hydrolase family protein n=1 Tax=Arthrobacter castelli TaxID=271431 RepID=UPI0004175248|nr:S9 family peptidase [Arthrobacter castelli]
MTSDSSAAASGNPEAANPPETPFHDLDHYIALPRISGLTLSPDGQRLVTSVATLNTESTEYTTALWELDPSGNVPARRLTRSAKGESGAAFAGDGSLLFTSARPDSKPAEDQPAKALWELPAAGGEARVVIARTGGISSVLTAKGSTDSFVKAPVLPGSTDEESDAGMRAGRQDNKVAAILHSGYPVRFWDSDLGPEQPRIFAVEADATAGGRAGNGRPGTTEEETARKLRNVGGDTGEGLRETATVVSPDGKTIITGMNKPLAKGDMRTMLVRINTVTGARTVLLDEDGMDFRPGPISWDNSTVVVVSERHSTAAEAPVERLNLLPVAGGELQPVASSWDRWPQPHAWTLDDSALLVTADDGGRSPVFSVSIQGGEVTRVTGDDAAYTDVVVSNDGGTAYAVRSSYLLPPEVVRIDLASGETTRLPAPAERPTIPGRLEEVETRAADGSRIRAWLALPNDAGGSAPAPLLLWIHGGPLGSWNAWTWRWNPWLMTAQGYAVLLPDPALSTGYGQDFIQRGWGEWGENPFTDLMTITDEVERRPDIDETRTAAMGGSFGGYMANWVAGHTDRFDAVVTHASLWALDQFGPTTDAAFFWEKEMTPERARLNSPHLHVENIRTPMLVIHGDKDYRVPIGEGLRLWYELLSKSALAADENGDTEHRFLYYPNENHWILTPQHAKLWYSVVLGFLSEYVLGKSVDLPKELGI